MSDTVAVTLDAPAADLLPINQVLFAYVLCEQIFWFKNLHVYELPRHSPGGTKRRAPLVHY